MTALPKDHNQMFTEPEVTPDLGAEHGLSADEYALMLEIVGRTPSFTELGIFSVMWSEHCSYKSSRFHLKKLPTTAPWVIQGPGENAGVIDIGDGQAAVFKMESHNHPSFIEPFQGAATGVGGILRDVFTMGARPIAAVNALRFGDPSHPKTKYLVDGVVAGIAHYGNCFGVPTVAGQTDFHAAYNGNPLVNAMVVGLADTDKIFYARGASADQPVVYVGAKTGRDGIHGATMASAEFSDEKEAERPTVQVGDPFTEKLLMEACLELMQEDAIVSIQDMGAAGLTSSSVEIADKGEIGVELTLDHVPQRERGMSPYEIMLSESQERMLMILKPGREEVARKVFEKWDLDFAVIGRTTKERSLKLMMHNECWCDIPVPPLVDQAPEYDRPRGTYPKPKDVQQKTYTYKTGNALGDLKTLLQSPDLSSKRWIWEQYDSLVRGETVTSPGICETQSLGASDAAIVRVHDNGKAVAITTDCTPRYVQANPFEGAKQAVAESYRNLCASGAVPLAVTNNLNFGNPERPEIMEQFAASIEGLGEACRALEYPVISGNVSLYNETDGKAILPTPVIGGVGVIGNWQNAMTMDFKAVDETIYLIGAAGSHLGQSLFLRECYAEENGEAPIVDLVSEKRTGEAIRTCIQNKLISACHDVSDGGVLVSVAEMAMASGGIGAELAYDDDTPAFWFGEDQGRYMVSTVDAGALEALLNKENIPYVKLGRTCPDALNIQGQTVRIQDLVALNERWLPDYMSGAAREE